MSPISSTTRIYVLNYGAGNIQSLKNALEQVTSLPIYDIQSKEDFQFADLLVFPGVGAFGAAMHALDQVEWRTPLLQYLHAGKPFLGICIGMQVLFQSSEESPGVKGLGWIPLPITKLRPQRKCVPHMGWNRIYVSQKCPYQISSQDRFYFVHSYGFRPQSNKEEDIEWSYIHSITQYDQECLVASIAFRNVFATQFHPEKSGQRGLKLLKQYLECPLLHLPLKRWPRSIKFETRQDGMTKRIIACLDVRSNDANQLVVTKGDQYCVRDPENEQLIRNLGDPVEMATRYYQEGVDEITLLQIISYRTNPLVNSPMLTLLQELARQVFVPLTVGGGIRDIQTDQGLIRALDIVDAYFSCGADKVSIGSDAVLAAERLWALSIDGTLPEYGDGTSSIEQIAQKYGRQAVVVSIDPKRVYVADPSLTTQTVLMAPSNAEGPQGERYCWYQCTVKGGREARDLDVHQLARAVEKLGAGELLVNCIDRDGTSNGFEIGLMDSIQKLVKIPVIASSGAGEVRHFSDLFRMTKVDAALAAGIFHRNEVSIHSIKHHLQDQGITIRET